MSVSTSWHAHQRGLTQRADSSPALNPRWAALQPCAEPACSAPGEASLSRRALPTQGTPLPAGPPGKHSWDGFGQCPPAIMAGSHGHLHSRAPGQGVSPRSMDSLRQPAAKHPGAGTGANRGCPSATPTAASWRGQNPPSTWEMLVLVSVISQRGNTESKMHNQDSRYTSCVFQNKRRCTPASMSLPFPTKGPSTAGTETIAKWTIITSSRQDVPVPQTFHSFNNTFFNLVTSSQGGKRLRRNGVWLPQRHEISVAELSSRHL